MSRQQKVPDVVRDVLDRAAVSIEGLAEEAGVSSASLYAWAAGRRSPSPENIQKLAAALERRGGELSELADRLRKLAGED